jgi:hypothetical protein
VCVREREKKTNDIKRRKRLIYKIMNMKKTKRLNNIEKKKKRKEMFLFNVHLFKKEHVDDFVD